MATLASLTLDVLDQLYGQAKLERPAADRLATAVASTSDTSFQFERAGSQFWEYNDYAEFDDGTGAAGEIIRFFEDHNEPNTDVIVSRGERRSTAASSFAVGDVFLKNPSYTKVEIQKAINETIDSDMQTGIWYRSARTLEYEVGRDRYPIDAADFKIEKMVQRDTASTLVGTGDGTVTFDFEGGLADDLWTSTTGDHDLVIGDAVRFSAVGTGADEFGLGIIYYVAARIGLAAVQLSATKSETVLEGTADSVGTWTMQKVPVFDYTQFADADYDLLMNEDTASEGTTRMVIIRRLVSADATIYYVTQTRPSSSAISALPTELTNMIPYGAISRLVGGTAVRSRPASDTTISYADAAWFRDEFDRQLDQTRKRLRKELPALRHFVFGAVTSGSHRGGFRGDPFA